MVTMAQIENTLERADFSPKQSRAIAEVIELAQRKTQEEVETDLRHWMVDRFFTKADGANLRAEMINWMFIFWVGQIAAFATILKLFK